MHPLLSGPGLLLLAALWGCQGEAPVGGDAGTGGGDAGTGDEGGGDDGDDEGGGDEGGGDEGGGDDTGVEIPTWTDPILAGETIDLEVDGPELTDAALTPDGLLLYVGQEQKGDGGLWVYDVADPAAPVLLGKTSTWHLQRVCYVADEAGTRDVFAVTRDGELAHIALEAGVPTLTRTWRVGLRSEGLDCTAEHLAVALGEDGTLLYALSEGPELVEVARVEGAARDVLLEEERLWILGPQDLRAVAPIGEDPVETGSLTLEGSCSDLSPGAEWLALACGAGGVSLVDRGEGTPTELGRWEGHASARAVSVAGDAEGEDHLLVAAWTELLLVDAADPAAPWLRATEPARSAVMSVVAAEEGRGWVADWKAPFGVSWSRDTAPEARLGAPSVLAGESVRITNDGTEDLWLGPPMEGSLGEGGSPTVVAPGESVSWSIPEGAVGAIGVGTNDPDEDELIVQVSDATGMSLGAEAPDFIEIDLDKTTWQLSALRGEVVFLGLFTEG